MFQAKKILILALASCILALAGCSPFRMAPVDGIVIDAETQEPVEGALVVAEWLTIYGIHGNHHNDIQVFDIRTEKDGKFTLIEWNEFKTLHAIAPIVTTYHEGYKLSVVAYGSYKRRYPGKELIVELERSSEHEILSDKKRSLNRLNEIFSRRSDLPCFWQRLPFLTRQLIEGKSSLDKAGIKNGLYSASSFKKLCPSSRIKLEDT